MTNFSSMFKYICTSDCLKTFCALYLVLYFIQLIFSNELFLCRPDYKCHIMILMLVTRGRDMMYKHNEKKILMNLFL